MDKVHEVDKKPWISKKIYQLNELIVKRTKQLSENGVYLHEEINDEQNLENALKDFIKSNQETIKPSFLFNSTDEKTLVDDEECDLQTYKLQLQHAKKVLKSRVYRVEYLSRLQTTRREVLMRHLASMDCSSPQQDDLVISRKRNQNFVTLLTIQIWPQPSKETKVRLQKEIIFRSDNFLVELRNQIKCHEDYGVPIDLSENPNQNERILRGELFKSGFFLIHNTFYNDMRDVNNIDLCQSIKDWASKPVEVVNPDGYNIVVDKGIGPFKSRRMETSTFDDLEFRLGCPYLYLHQGDCEHLFTISDIKFVPYDRIIQQTVFPIITATSIGRKHDYLKCYMCKERPPQWYTRNNHRLPMDPFFFCEDCFYSFNYDQDGKKVGNFQAYLYTAILGIPDNIGIK